MEKSFIIVCLVLVLRNVSSQSSNKCNTPNRIVGTCVNINSCQTLRKIIENRKMNSSELAFLRSSLCGYEGSDPKVCCPPTTSTTTTTTTTTTTSTLRPTTVPDPLPKLTSQITCGRSSSTFKDRIVGGSNSSLGDWPWMTAVGSTNRNGQVDWICGGTLISDGYVVTAAHCTERILSVARLGDLNLDPLVNDDAQPIDIPIMRVIVHPQYNRLQVTNDIALLKLERIVTFNKLIQPICLPTPPNVRNQTFVKKLPTVSGWGATSFRGPSSNHLKEAPLLVFDEEECKKSFSSKRNVVIDKRVLCAGDMIGKTDSCQGDSGGPLMLPIDGQFYLVGVVSFGIKCAEPGFPGVYTRVSAFVDWITNIINNS